MVVRILFILPDLSGGGAQRVATVLMRNLDRERFRPEAALLGKTGEFLDEVPSDVPIIDLGGVRTRWAGRVIRRVIKDRRPDVVFSFLGYFNLVVALNIPWFGPRPRFVARETNLPSILNPVLPYPWLVKRLYRLLYRRFDRVVCQSGDMKNDLVSFAKLPPEKAVVIHNPVDVDRVATAGKSAAVLNPAKRNLVAVGKLKRQKGFDILLEAMARMRTESVHLTILGQGPEREALQTRADRLGLSERVTFTGFKADPYPYLAQADLFVLSSRYEGFPNVLLEAGACGTYAVCFQCPGGIDEIITPGLNGRLVPPEDEAALAEALDSALSEKPDRDRIRTDTRDRFDVEMIVEQYGRLFEGTLPG